MNAGDACSGGPSGVGLSSCAGTVASRRARLGRTEVRQAKRAGAEEASMLPPNPVETWTYHLKSRTRINKSTFPGRILSINGPDSACKLYSAA